MTGPQLERLRAQSMREFRVMNLAAATVEAPEKK